MTEIMQQLIDMLKEMSPFVWETLIKQAYVGGIIYLVWALFFLLVAILCWRAVNIINKTLVENKKNEELNWSRKYGEEKVETLDSDQEMNYNIMGVIAAIATFISSPLSLGFFMTALPRFINPEFYAIRYIIDSLGGG